jgi:uncharacterized membrane protein YbhN (UPF0104 family)
VHHTRLISVFSFLLLLLITILLIRRYDVRLSELLSFGSPATHLAAFGTTIVELLSRAARTRLLARGLQARLSWRQSMAVQVAADGAGAVTPARIGSDPAKLLILTRSGIDLPRAGAILVGEALSEAALLTLLALLMAASIRPGGVAALGALTYVVSTGAAVIGALLVSGPNRKRILRALPLSDQRRLVVLQGLRHFASHARKLFGLPAGYVAGVSVAAGLHICARTALLPILCAGLVNPAQLPALAAWSFTLLYAGALVPLPSAGGMIELGFAAALSHAIPADALIAVMLWWRIYTTYLGALAGALVLSFTRRHA